jgi:hypothetical protein
MDFSWESDIMNEELEHLGIWGFLEKKKRGYFF